ncbi:MAG: hypothetical protein JXK07_10040 [Spirochaetes bacterium]|nr:hypothetical protein [Spirochaetota bacterium]MBN2771262.1 hypothetical protein [Spirochaetota bacterium]
MKKQTIKAILSKKRADIELVEFDAALCALDDDSYEDLDILLIENLPDLFTEHCGVGPELDSTWRWYGEDILNAGYPVEKLPEHVRDIAIKLYYIDAK